MKARIPRTATKSVACDVGSKSVGLLQFVVIATSLVPAVSCTERSHNLY